MMDKYRKRPVVVEAVRYQPGPGGNCAAVHEWLDLEHTGDSCWEDAEVYIETAYGLMTAEPGDWIVRGADGELYTPCKPDIFEATYEAVSSDHD